MSNYRILNLTLATILTSAIPFLTANNIAIAQSTNQILNETNLQSTTPAEQLSDEQIDLLLDQCIEFINFLAGTEIDSYDKESIFRSSSLHRELPKNKKEHILLLQTIDKIMSDIKGKTIDFPTHVRIRKEIFSTLYFDVNAFRQNITSASSLTKPTMFIVDILEMVERHNSVIVADEKSQLLVTERDLVGIIFSDIFLAKQVGKLPIIRNDLSETIRQNFLDLPPNEQKSLANAESNYYLLKSRWSKMSAQQQQALLNKTFANTNSSPQQQPSVRSHNNQSKPRTTSTTPSKPQISPENQRRLNEAASNAEQFNRINQQQMTIEPIYNPAFDVPSF